MNRRWEYRFYRRLGILVLIGLVITVTISLVYAPESQVISDKICQQYKVRGIDAKQNNLAFKKFLTGIKQNDGVLVLGSSETGAFGEENYHGLMNSHLIADIIFQ